MFLQQRLCSLLELLGTDLFGSKTLRNDEGTPGHFSEALGKDLGVDNVTFDDLHVVVVAERSVHGTGVHLLGGFEQQTVLVKGHLNDADAVGFCQPCHEVA